MTDLKQFRPLIERALAYTDGVCTWEALEKEVDAGRAFPMISPTSRSIAILQPVHDLHVFTASGDLNELMVMEAEAARIATRSGYDRMTMIGRRGWERVLRSRGWKPESGLVKEL